MGICSRAATVLVLTIIGFAGSGAFADEGGISFWLPGKYGSFAAVTPPLGWSLPFVFYSYGGSASAERTLQRGNLLTAGLKGSFNGLFIVPTYTPDTALLGGHSSFSVAFAPAYVNSSGSVDLARRSVSKTDSLFGGSDLYPTVQLNWVAGVHNFMTYVAGDIPVGSYNPNRLSNVGIGHGAIDAGVGYTYLNTKSGTEASAILGFTKNFQNLAINYTNGLDSHLDVAVAQFLSAKLFVGVTAYYYQQLTADRGQPPALGPFESRTRAIGPQLGYNFDVGGVPLYANLRGYKEFGSSDRLQGFSIYATVNMPLSALFQGR